MIKPHRKIFVLALLFIPCYFLYSRAGGGGHSGGGGGGGFHSTSHNVSSSNLGDFGPLLIIVIIALLGYGLVLSFLLFIKPKRSSKVIELASQIDELWNLEQINKHTFDVFCKMQKAWETRNLGPVKSIITKELYDELDEKITVMRSENQKNILEEINVNKITLISSVDYKDNSKDAYTAQIDGQMIDYIIDDRSNEIIENTQKSIGGFTDCYEFVRINNKWILNKIYNDSGIFNLMDAKNHFEK